MGSLQKRIIEAIDTMRAARNTPTRSIGGLTVPPSARIAPARLREALFSDFDAVAELKQNYGLGEDSREDWERLWKRNPALGHMQFQPPIGWVLEAEGRPVGYLGNISLLYRYGDRTLTAVTGCGFAVEPAYRAVSSCLVAAFYRQRPVDLYLTTTANEHSAKIVRAFKSVPFPQADYETLLFWVLQPSPFAKAVIKKLKLRPTFSRMSGMLAAFAVGTDTILRRRWPRQRSKYLAVNEISVSDIGDDFQTLWREKLRERPQRLLADRSSATLRWHFESGSVHVLCCYKNGELLGYAVTRNEHNEVNGLRHSIIADMLVRQDEPLIVRSLLAAAYDYAKRDGSHILEVLGFPYSIRQLCSHWRPYLKSDPICHSYFKAAEPILHRTLSDGMAWYATAFDGDKTLP
jgi:hypothetical protein